MRQIKQLCHCFCQFAVWAVNKSCSKGFSHRSYSYHLWQKLKLTFITTPAVKKRPHLCKKIWRTRSKTSINTGMAYQRRLAEWKCDSVLSLQCLSSKVALILVQLILNSCICPAHTHNQTFVTVWPLVHTNSIRIETKLWTLNTK